MCESFTCLPVWNSSPVDAESFPLLQSVFQTCFYVQPITDILLYLVSYMKIKCIVLLKENNCWIPVFFPLATSGILFFNVKLNFNRGKSLTSPIVMMNA